MCLVLRSTRLHWVSYHESYRVTERPAACAVIANTEMVGDNDDAWTSPWDRVPRYFNLRGSARSWWDHAIRGR